MGITQQREVELAGNVDRKRIGIVFALSEGREGFERVMSDARASGLIWQGLRCWSAGRIELVAAVSGVGGKRSAQATESILKNGVEAVVCAGLAAGLDAQLQVGDVVVAGRVLGDADPVVCRKLGQFTCPPVRLGYSVRQGDLVTHSSIVRTPADKAEIRAATGASALDMESYAAGRVCSLRGVPFAAIRSISDTAADRLPDVVGALAATQNAMTRFFLTASCPRAWPGLVRLRRQARVAADNLGDFLALVLVRIGRRSEQARKTHAPGDLL